MGRSTSSPSERFTLADLDLTAAERATVLDFLESWKEHGRPVLFVGAGMSKCNAVRKTGAPATAEIEDWSGLIAALKQRLSAGHTDADRAPQFPSDYLRLRIPT